MVLLLVGITADLTSSVEFLTFRLFAVIIGYFLDAEITIYDEFIFSGFWVISVILILSCYDRKL